MSLLIPLFFYIIFKEPLLEHNTRLFLTFSISAICLWTFSLTPAYLPPLIVITSSLVLDLAPKSAIFSGFGSENFLMLFSVLALGRAIASSGILYRMMLVILKFMPTTHFWVNTSIFILGTFITPFVPSSETRQELLKLLTKDFTRQLTLSSSSLTTHKILISAYAGTTLLGPVFLTSSLYNLFIFSLLTTNQGPFFWTDWFFNALPTGIFLLIFFSVSLNFFFKENEKAVPFRERIESQRKVLGKIRGEERGLCFVSLFYLAALMSRNYHGIPDAYVSVIMFSILVIFNLISPDELRRKLDWQILFLFALLTGVAGTFNSLDLSGYALSLPDFFDQLIKKDFASFALILGLALTLVRIFMPYGLTVVIAALLLFPFAQQHGLNSWLTGFLILLFSKESLIPTSSGSLKNFMMTCSENHEISCLSLWKYHLMINLVKFAAVYFSVSFWKDMSLI